MSSLHDRYVLALNRELSILASSHGGEVVLDSIFLGGGTPSILSHAHLRAIFTTIRRDFTLGKDPEISIEVNPGTAGEAELDGFLDIGINRISVGVQSFLDKELHFLGRSHSAREAGDVVQAARRCGFGNISLDLMYGIPGQSFEDWKFNLDTAVNLLPDHLSMYQLTFEEGTPLGVEYQKKRIGEPSEDLILSMDAYNDRKTSERSLNRYEISNFARSGYECRHNIVYWNNGDYMAAGASAVSCISRVREKRVDDPASYCTAIEERGSAIVERERLGREDSFRETIMMGLRMTEGVSVTDLQSRFCIDIQEYYGDVLSPLIKAGYVEFTADRFRATVKGRLLLNSILAELI